MDTHKTDAELSFLSSGEEVHHPLPVRVDDLCFISNTNRKISDDTSGRMLFAIPECGNIKCSWGTAAQELQKGVNP
jgi:hypothetical protein